MLSSEDSGEPAGFSGHWACHFRGHALSRMPRVAGIMQRSQHSFDLQGISGPGTGSRRVTDATPHGTYSPFTLQPSVRTEYA